MSHRAHAVFLEDFSGRTRPAPERDRKPDPVEQARIAARDEAMAEARQAQAILLRDLEACHQKELEDARALWVRTEAQRLDEALERIKAEIVDALSVHLADCLRPFLERSAQDAALAAFASGLRDLMEKRDALRLIVTGPADRLAAVRARLGERAACCDFVESDEVGLEASLAGSVVALRLDEWLGAFERCES